MTSKTTPMVDRIDIFSTKPAMSKMIPSTITVQPFLFHLLFARL